MFLFLPGLTWKADLGLSKANWFNKITELKQTAFQERIPLQIVPGFRDDTHVCTALEIFLLVKLLCQSNNWTVSQKSWEGENKSEKANKEMWVGRDKIVILDVLHMKRCKV